MNCNDTHCITYLRLRLKILRVKSVSLTPAATVLRTKKLKQKANEGRET